MKIDKPTQIEKPNYYYLTSEGCQTLYGAITQRKKSDSTSVPEVQLAFNGGMGVVTCLIVPHPPSELTAPFNSSSMGKWYAVVTGEARKLTQVYPDEILDPPAALALFPDIIFLSSTQHADVFWHLGRFGLPWTSRSSGKVFKSLAQAKLQSNIPFNSLFELLGFDNFLPEDIPHTADSPSTYINTFQDRASLWQSLKVINSPIPLINQQGQEVQGKFVNGKASLQNMKRSAIQFFDSNPLLFQRITNMSLEAIIFPDVLENMVLPPIQRKELNNFTRGRENETVMTRELPELLERYSNGRYRVLGAFTVGLLTRSDSLAAGAGSSPDLLVHLQDTVEQRTFVAVVEFKTATTESSQELLREQTASTANFLNLELTNETFPLLVPDQEHRCQVLHHAATLKISAVLYIRGVYQSLQLRNQPHSPSIQLISLLHVPENIIQSYHSFLTHLYQELDLENLFTLLKTAPTPTPPRLLQLGLFDINGRALHRLARIHDTHSLGLNLRLGKIVHQLHQSSDKPPPPSKKLLPYVCALWNFYKGFSDVSSRPKEDFKLKFNKGAGCKVVCRLLASQVLNVSKLMRLFQGYQQVQSADTLGKIRSLLNSRHDPTKAYHVFLKTSYSALRGLFLVTATPQTPRQGLSAESSSTPDLVTPPKYLTALTRLRTAKSKRLISETHSSTPIAALHHPKKSSKKKGCVECEGSMDSLPQGRPRDANSKGVRTPQTRWRCLDCNVTLHSPLSQKFPNCWNAFHSRVEGTKAEYNRRSRPAKRRESAAGSVIPFNSDELLNSVIPLNSDELLND